MKSDSVKILYILRELNIGLDTLNQELAFLGLNGFDINHKISSKDKDFIVAYFKTEQMIAIDKMRYDMAILHNQLKSFYLKNNPDPINMGELEKKQYFNFLLNQKNITSPNVTEFSEEAFWKLYNWYKNWIKKSNAEQHDIIEKKYEEILEEDEGELKTDIRFDSSDYESEFISAIRRGEGDTFGF